MANNDLQEYSRGLAGGGGDSLMAAWGRSNASVNADLAQMNRRQPVIERQPGIGGGGGGNKVLTFLEMLSVVVLCGMWGLLYYYMGQYFTASTAWLFRMCGLSLSEYIVVGLVFVEITLATVFIHRQLAKWAYPRRLWIGVVFSAIATIGLIGWGAFLNGKAASWMFLLAAFSLLCVWLFYRSAMKQRSDPA